MSWMRVTTDQGWEIRSTSMTITCLSIHFKECEFDAQGKWIGLVK